MLPVTEFLERLEREGAARKTLSFYGGPVKKFALHCNKDLLEVTVDDIYDFAKTITSSDYCRHNTVRAINYFLKHSGSGVEAKLPSFTPPATDEYSYEQIKQLFSVATDDERRLFMFYHMTGCREGEVMHAVWPNLTDTAYTVRPAVGWNPKKFKTRTIPVPDVLLRLLEPVRGTGIMFPNKFGRVDGHHLIKLQRLAKRSGQDPTLFCLQRFRRTFATTLLRTGATVHEVAGFLGHGDLNTIMRYLALANCKNERVRALTNSAFSLV
jgi:integrase